MSSEDRSRISTDLSGAAAWAPASLSNLGPGFDCLGLAVDVWGDTVEAFPDDRQGVSIRYHPESAWRGAETAGENTAGKAASRVLERLSMSGGVELVIRKGLIPGSGLGSSAASAAAAAVAVNQLHGAPLSRQELVEAVLDGEAVASRARHGDNALSALFGGVVLVSAEDPIQYRLLGTPDPPPIAILLPRVEILTANARALLPESVPFTSAVSNASNLANLVAAMIAGDWEEAGRMMMRDRIVEPVRAGLIPGFSMIRSAALEAGAFGCAVSGSGPAIFALAPDDATARKALEAMTAAVPADWPRPGGVVAKIDRAGARTVPLGSGHALADRQQ